MRDLAGLIATCAGHGPNVGIYAERLLDDPLPWTRMRAVYRLLGLVRRYGPDRSKGLLTAWISTSSRSARSPRCWNAPPRTPPRHCRRPSATTSTRFARDPAEFTYHPNTIDRRTPTNRAPRRPAT